MSFQSNRAAKAISCYLACTQKAGVSRVFTEIPQDYEMEIPLHGICWNNSTICKGRKDFSLYRN